MEKNLRYSEEKNCMMCKHFESYEQIYEDPMEPYDVGKCREPSYEGDEQVSDHLVCNFIEIMKKE